MGGLLLAAVSLSADDADDAAALAVKANSEATAGNYETAIELFRKARALDDRPEYVCNIGTAYYRRNRFPEAQAYFEMCLARKGSVSADYAKVVKETFGYIDGQLRNGDYAPVDVAVSPKGALVRPEYLPAGNGLPGSRTLWFAFGSHDIEVSAPGHTTQTRTIEVTDRKPFTVKVELEPRADDRQPTTENRQPTTDDQGPNPARGASLGPPEMPHDHAADRKPTTDDRKPAWVAFIVAGAFVVGGGATHALAYNTREKLFGETKMARSDDETRFKRERAIAIGLYSAGAVAAGIGAYLWFRPPSRPPVGVDVDSDGAGGARVMLRWSGDL